MHMAATYMVLYSLYKSRLRQIKIRGCHTRCFHPFHILFTLFVLSSSATPASESSFYTLIHLAHSYLLVVKNEKSWAKYLNLGFQALNLTSNNFLVSWNISGHLYSIIIKSWRAILTILKDYRYILLLLFWDSAQTFSNKPAKQSCDLITEYKWL